MNRKIKLFTVVLGLCILLLCEMSLISSAASIVKNGSCGENLTWELDSEGVLTISGTGDMEVYPHIAASPWYNNSSIKSVVIGDGVHNISDYTFYGCAQLTSVTMPDSIMSIGDRAFASCRKLTSVELSDSIISLGDDVFYRCSSLKSIIIPKSVTSIGDYAFYGCSGLQEVHINDMAAWCEIDFHNEYSNPLCYAGNLYLNETLVTYLYIPSGTTNISDYAFYNCSSMLSIYIPNTVTSIADKAFLCCSSLMNFNVDNRNTEYCSIDGILYTKDEVKLICYPAGNTNTAYMIPDGVTSIGNNAFYGCIQLTNITIPESVIIIADNAFCNCRGLTNFAVDSNNTEYSTIEGNLFTKDGAKLLCYAVGNGSDTYIIPEGVTSIGNYAFYNCNRLTSVDLPDGLINIGDYAFYSCYKLTNVVIPDNVTGIGSYAFGECSEMMSIEIPSSITSIGENAFINCISLTTVYINDIAAWCEIDFHNEDSNPLSYARNLYLNGKLATDVFIPSGVARIGNFAFYNCSSLTSISIPEGVVEIGCGAFTECSGLQVIQIPSSVKKVGYDICSEGEPDLDRGLSSGDGTFYGCNSLNSVYISDVSAWCQIDFNVFWAHPLYYGGNLYLNGMLITELVIPSSVECIKDYAFYGCSSLTNITIPEGVTSIGQYAFSKCSSLTSITLPNSVTSIGYSAFSRCSSLASITIPEGVTSIGKYAFYECDGLKDVYYKGTQEEWNSIVIDGYNDSLKNATLHPKKAIAITNLTKADNITFTANLSAADRGLLIVARYGENGKNLGMKIYTAAAQVPVSIANDCETVKVMWWDGFYTMRILAPVVELDI